ncbi:hypothetical protein FisN_2Lh345 [Fistulifera solaris]|uniref:Glycoside hydrolase family 5 domain-containing protein n=1 Tax=Fistulifera solaris TaxID=1519565 RepID=A0A1Z5J807_FISSO|nr:hypothetical protein FisN_2Lh345 [Fistulifera solaris]|eukprot:GAX10076.1 hypothetical protein FisN_2Lh345 [Fistulifera solaris]
MMRYVFLRLLFLLWHVTTSSPLPTIEVQGYKFFDSHTGEEFVVRGIDYYPRPNYGDLNHNSLDLFSSQYRHIWERDVVYLQNLKVNVVRLYAVNASLNHDEFMHAMERAGIYVIVALAHDCPTCAVTRDAAPDCYPPELKWQGQRVIRAFRQYNNTLAFSAGNEVNHFAPPNQPEWNAPCQKKFIRDMRKYMASCPGRQIPIGLVSADNEREDLAQYYNCDEQDDYNRAEWYGINTYVSCDGAAQTYSDAPGFKLLEESFAQLNYSIPVLLTEFGCLSDSFPTIDGYEGQRNFLQGKWLLEEPSLREQFNGGIAFEYSIERENAGQYPFKTFNKQGYGVGYFSPELCDDINVSCAYNPMPSYKALRNVYAESQNVTTIRREDFEIAASRSGSSQCPTRFDRIDAFVWKADQTPNLVCAIEDETSSQISHQQSVIVRETGFTKLSVGNVALVAGLLTILGIGVFHKRLRHETPIMSNNGPDDSVPFLSLQGFKLNYNSIA